MNFFEKMTEPAFKRADLPLAEITAATPYPVSAAHIKGYKSALVYCYSCQDMTLLPRLDFKLNKLLTNYEKCLCTLRKESKIKLEEGKKPLTFAGYNILCEKIISLNQSNSNDISFNYTQTTFM